MTNGGIRPASYCCWGMAAEFPETLRRIFFFGRLWSTGWLISAVSNRMAADWIIHDGYWLWTVELNIDERKKRGSLLKGTGKKQLYCLLCRVSMCDTRPTLTERRLFTVTFLVFHFSWCHLTTYSSISSSPSSSFLHTVLHSRWFSTVVFSFWPSNDVPVWNRFEADRCRVI